MEIIAEIANAHQGDPKLALELARAAAAGSADAIKFQVYFGEELLASNHPRYRHFCEQAFSVAEYEWLLAEAHDLGPRIYCDVFGMRALEVARTSGVDAYKVHSSDLSNDPLLLALAESGQPVLLAVGGSTGREIARALGTVRGMADRPPVLLHGFQAYPTRIADSGLSRIQWLSETFGDVCEIGYMDHAAGDDPFAVHLPLMAMAMGATVIEKHVTLDRAAQGVDYYSALNPDEFAEFVAVMRRGEGGIGEPEPCFSEAELSYRQDVKKTWVTVSGLDAGHMLTQDDLAMRRIPNNDAEPLEASRILGRPLLDGRPAEHPVTRADVPQTVWATVVARMRSARLPGKAMLDVGGMPASGHLLERLKQAERLDRVVLCTTHEQEDDVLVEVAAAAGVPVHRGPGRDVLSRILGALRGHSVDVLVRVTGDDILVDPEYVDRAVAHHLAVNAEYSDLKQLPSGTEAEVFDVELLRDIWALARDRSETEYLTSYVTQNRTEFRTASVPVAPEHARGWRLTLDTDDDLTVIRALLDELAMRGKKLDYRLDDIVEVLEARPELLEANVESRYSPPPLPRSFALAWRRLLHRG